MIIYIYERVDLINLNQIANPKEKLKYRLDNFDFVYDFTYEKKDDANYRCIHKKDLNLNLEQAKKLFKKTLLEQYYTYNKNINLLQSENRLKDLLLALYMEKDKMKPEDRENILFKKAVDIYTKDTLRNLGNKNPDQYKKKRQEVEDAFNDKIYSFGKYIQERLMDYQLEDEVKNVFFDKYRLGEGLLENLIVEKENTISKETMSGQMLEKISATNHPDYVDKEMKFFPLKRMDQRLNDLIKNPDYYFKPESFSSICLINYKDKATGKNFYLIDGEGNHRTYIYKILNKLTDNEIVNNFPMKIKTLNYGIDLQKLKNLNTIVSYIKNLPKVKKDFNIHLDAGLIANGTVNIVFESKNKEDLNHFHINVDKYLGNINELPDVKNAISKKTDNSLIKSLKKIIKKIK